MENNIEYSKEIIKKFLDFIEKEKSLTAACIEMEMKPYDVLGLVYYIRSKGVNIAMKNTTDDIFMVNMGDCAFVEKNSYTFSTDEFDEFKFIVIADTRLGSTSQQLSILNDIYLKGHFKLTLFTHSVHHSGQLLHHFP